MQISNRANEKACPFVAGRFCLADCCMAWEAEHCRLICSMTPENVSPFEQKLQDAAPLMYRSLLDLVKIMEEARKDCQKCGPDLWNYAQEIRNNLLDELTKAELAEVGIRADKDRK
ncbi:MAG: hypothetical protein MUO26_01890 [Methanotrichaceae archaeon]|nr:hypothetical protein [Methanotrichaceae archaeon]